jgi:hypothetical protein
MRREDVLRDALCERRGGVRGGLLLPPCVLLRVVLFLSFELCVV